MSFRSEILASLVIVAATSALATDSPYGSWSLRLPFDTMNTGHLILEKDAAEQPTARFLWRWSSPGQAVRVRVVENRFEVMAKYHYRPKGSENDPTRCRTRMLIGIVSGEKADCVSYESDGLGLPTEAPVTFVASRQPPIGPRPDLSKIRCGTPIDLLSCSSLEEGFELIDWDKKEKVSGWTLKDGVLSNRVLRDEKGKSLHKNGNLRTRRADFLDFNLKYDVRVLPGCNSGVYLRGIYEIQVADSFGKPVNSHNMAALYGRITPSVAAERPAEEWQTVDVTLYRRHLTVVLNGTTIIDNLPVEGITGGALSADEFVPGPIYIQGDHSDADFRRMILTPIKH